MWLGTYISETYLIGSSDHILNGSSVSGGYNDSLEPPESDSDGDTHDFLLVDDDSHILEESL